MYPKAASTVPSARQIAGGIPVPPVRLLQVMSSDEWEGFTEGGLHFTKGKARTIPSDGIPVPATLASMSLLSLQRLDSKNLGTAISASTTIIRLNLVMCTGKLAKSSIIHFSARPLLTNSAGYPDVTCSLPRVVPVLRSDGG